MLKVNDIIGIKLPYGVDICHECKKIMDLDDLITVTKFLPIGNNTIDVAIKMPVEMCPECRDFYFEQVKGYFGFKKQGVPVV